MRPAPYGKATDGTVQCEQANAAYQPHVFSRSGLHEGYPPRCRWCGKERAE